MFTHNYEQDPSTSGTKSSALQSLKDNSLEWLLHCTECTCSSSRRNVVPFRSFGKGIRIAIIGEQPGEVEDFTGLPFWGETRRVINFYTKRIRATWLLTNTVLCKPSSGYAKKHERTKCEPNVAQILAKFKPEGVIRVGDAPNFGYPSVKITNPTQILNQEYKMTSILLDLDKINSWIRSLSN